MQLALMAKAKLVFESDDTFLSFPVLSPRSYPPDRLKFIKPSGAMTPQDLADLSEFARITNRIPRGVLAPEDEEEYLWDVYHEVLATAQLASGSMSASDKAKYEGAMAFLYVAGPDGLRRPSAALTAYKQHRDAHIKAQEEYKGAQLTAEASDDPAVQSRWRDADEPRLREAVRHIEQAWLTVGYKAQVEAAQQIERTHAARDPALIWTEWQESFIADLDMATDTNNIRYAITGVSPYDLFDIGSWPRFTLTRAEMTRLAPQAPPELLAIFGPSPGTSDIESVSFEFRSVALTRPWLASTLFKARFWRLGAGAEPLSEGGTPPAKGRCPAYISALVFARNVTVQRRPQPGAAPVVTAEKPSMLLQLAPHRVAAAQQMKAQLYPAASAPLHTAVVEPRLTSHLTVARVAGVSPALGRLRIRPVPAEAEGANTPTRTSLTAARVLARLEAQGFSAVSPSPTPDPLLGPQFVCGTPLPHTAPSDEIMILAYICKGLPLCPDADTALHW